MLLATRELDATLTDNCLISEREKVVIMDKVISIGLAASIVHQLFDLCIVHAVEAETESNVLSDCTGEEHGLLLDNSDLVMVPFGVQIFDICAIKDDLALIRVIETLNHLNDGALAAATGAAKCHNSVLLSIDRERDSLEHLYVFFARVSELDVAELKITLDFALWL